MLVDEKKVDQNQPLIDQVEQLHGLLIDIGEGELLNRMGYSLYTKTLDNGNYCATALSRVEELMIRSVVWQGSPEDAVTYQLGLRAGRHCESRSPQHAVRGVILRILSPMIDLAVSGDTPNRSQGATPEEVWGEDVQRDIETEAGGFDSQRGMQA